MNPITNDELVSHVLGFTSPARAAEIDAAAHENASLAAKLLCMRRSVGLEEAQEPAPIPLASAQRRRRWLPATQPWRALAASLAVLLMSVGVSWAGWHLLKPQPLLQDDFEDDWGDQALWTTPRRVVREEGGHLRLQDRGYLVTVAEFREPVRITFRWKWIDLGGDFAYRESLSVALRTSGTPNPQFTHEVLDGIIVRLDANAGLVAIDDAADGKDPLAITPKGSVKLPADKWHEVTIIDDGTGIQVFLKGPALTPEQQENPILTAFVPYRPGQRHVAFYNRERMAAVSFESWLDELRIWPLGR